jgi:hypothetical protein
MRFRRIAILTIALSGVMSAIYASVPRWRRYVSRPLDDGTRVTFVYPATLRAAPGQWASLGRPHSFPGAIIRTVRLFGLTGGYDGEYIRLGYDLDGSRPPEGKSAARHRWECGNGGPPRGWDVAVNHPASGRVYQLRYCLSYDEPGDFKSRSAVIDKSFRVLAAEEPIPDDFPVTQGAALKQTPACKVCF